MTSPAAPAAAHLGFCILYTRDLLATIDFYERAFGMARKAIHGGTFAEMEGPIPLCFAAEALAADSVGAFAPARPDAPPPAVELGLVVPDVAAAYARALAAGAVAHRPPRAMPWGQIVAYVRDPDGVLVELCTAWS